MRRTTANVIVAILLGGLVGNVIGEVLRVIVPQGPVKNLFLKSVDFGFSPFTIDIAIAKFTLGFVLHFNLLAALFIFLMIYLLSRF
jgi:uncharacterized membrane protein YjgN (DUF898 family)